MKYLKIIRTVIRLNLIATLLLIIPVSIYGQAPAGNNQEVQFNNNGVFGASSNLTWDGTNLKFLDLGSYSAKLYFRSETGDDSSIFSENWGANKNRLVFHTRDDGDDDYAVFRNRHWNDGEKDVFEIHRTWTMANSNFYVMNGNLGLGTTSPSGKLDIFGANSNTTNLVLSANYIDKHRWRFNTIDRGYAIDLDITSSNGSDTQEAVLKLSRSNSTRPEFQLYNDAIVANDGKVGIGIANPSSKLEISYGGGSTSTPGVRIYGGGAVYENITLSLDDTGTASNNINILEFKNSSLRSAVIKSINPTSNNSNGGNLILETTSSYIGTLNENQLFLKNTGDVGIGTNTPDSKLTVAGNIHSQEVKVTVNAGADFVFNDDYSLPKLEDVEKEIH